MKRFIAALLCLVFLLGLFPATASAASHHSIIYDSSTLPFSQLVFTVGDTAKIPFKLYRGSQASSYEKYYVYIYNENGGTEVQCVDEFSFGSAYIVNLTVTWEVDREPGTYYLEYYDTASSGVGHTKIPITVKAKAGEHIITDNTVKQSAVVGYPNQAVSAWYNTSVTYQRWSHYDPIPVEIQLKEIIFGDTGAAVAKTENSFNDEPSPTQQWIFMRFTLKNCGSTKLEANNIIYDDRFFTEQGAKIQVSDYASFSGKRKGTGPFDVDLFPGASGDVWFGILVEKSAGFPLLMIYAGANEKYAFLDTDPFRPELHQHTYAEVSRTDATCLNSGSVLQKCGCGASNTVTLAPLGHNMVNGVCSRCGFDLPFTDVEANDWYYEAVRFAVNNKLFNGTSDTTFAPNKTMTRAMLVTVLWRYAGSPDEGTSTFSDVKSNAYYAKAVAWAAANNVVTGVGNNRFNPDGTVTREQMATILFRYAQNNGFDTSLKGNLSSFPDSNAVSSWAKDAMSWAVAMELINGSNGKLLPQSGATRAQVATILMRFIENCQPV